MVVDVSVAHHANIPSGPIDVPLASSAAREKKKVKLYQKDCDAMGLEFMPIVFESTGALGQSAKDFFTALLTNSSCTVDDLNTADDFPAITRSIIIALHRSTGDKFIAAAQIFRGDAFRYDYDEALCAPLSRLARAFHSIAPLE